MTIKAAFQLMPLICAAAAILAPHPVSAQETKRQFRPAFTLGDDVELLTGITYGEPDGNPLHLDLFLPKARPSPRPIIVFVPGLSGYMTEQFWRQAAALAQAGNACAVIEYRQTRLGGWVRFPESLHDARAALDWLIGHAGELALDPSRIGLVGASQGGYLAALLALYDGEADGQGPAWADDVRAVALLNPALDLTDPFLRSNGSETFPEIALGIPFSDAPEVWMDASPISHVDGDSPAFLFLHGVNDNSAPYWQSVRMADALLGAGVRAEIFTAGTGEHGFFNTPPWYQPALDAIEEFFDRTLIGDQAQLTVRSEVYDGHTSAAVAPDGQRIAFASQRNGDFDIYVVNIDGSELHRLTGSPEPDEGPEWSPDGSRILFESGTPESMTLVIIDDDGSDARNVLEKGLWVDGGGGWSPDGSHIVFVSTRDGNREIYTMTADGGSLQRLTTNYAFDSAPIWSPDGERIAWVSDRDGSHDVFVMRVDGSEQTNLTRNTAWDSKPAWSPDSQRIAFLSNRDGKVDLYLMDADGTNVEMLAGTDEGTVGGEGRPAWFPDGQKIIYGVDGKLVIMDLATRTASEIQIQWR